jgi:hypothetical protein
MWIPPEKFPDCFKADDAPAIPASACSTATGLNVQSGATDVIRNKVKDQ